MSCYVVDFGHIDALLTMACRYGVYINIPPVAGEGFKPNASQTVNMGTVSDDDLTVMGNMLLRINHHAYFCRYEGRHGSDEPYAEDYQYRRWGCAGSYMQDGSAPVRTIKACNGYSYQAEESNEWAGSWAQQFIECLQSAAIDKLRGYGDAEWEITR